MPKLFVLYSIRLCFWLTDIISCCSSANVMGAFSDEAIASKTGRVSGAVSPTTTGIPCLMIPDFSIAMSSSELPRNCVWSILMLVMTDKIGMMMFVQSRRPPMPTSITAISTCLSAKYLKAMAVVTSKKDGCRGAKNDFSSSTKFTTYSSSIGRPLIRIRSLKSTRWGDV